MPEGRQKVSVQDLAETCHLQQAAFGGSLQFGLAGTESPGNSIAVAAMAADIPDPDPAVDAGRDFVSAGKYLDIFQQSSCH